MMSLSLIRPFMDSELVPSDGAVMTNQELKEEDPEFTYEGVSQPIFDGFYEYVATYVDDLTIFS